MDYLKAKGETHLRPAMRRLILWGMASPLIAFLTDLTISIILNVEMNLASLALGCLAIFGSPIVVIWGIREFSKAKKEPHQFLGLFRTMIILNALLIVYWLGVTVLVFIALRND